MASWLTAHADVECCDVTTIGRRSGKRTRDRDLVRGHRRHDVPDLRQRTDGRLVSQCAGRSRRVGALGGETHAGVARDVTDPDERRRVGDLMGEKYPWDGDPSIGLTRQAWCYEVPLLAIDRWDTR